VAQTGEIGPCDRTSDGEGDRRPLVPMHTLIRPPEASKLTVGPDR
jgi:hypothetical protein